MTPGPARPARPPAGPARPPDVPGYTTGRLLGFGGSGEVWSATEDASGLRVAVKMLPVAADNRSAVLRECMLLRRIDHPHVVRLRGVVELADHIALVLDHAPGGSLAALVGARGGLDAGEVVTVLSPLATALADLHARGLVHGDVSPGNVLFAGDGRPLLSDLGVAGLVGLDRQSQEGQHGTPGYTDPAVLAGGAPTPASDVFGLCAAAWFALTGRPPQPAGSRPPLIPLAPDTPADLAALVEKGMDPAPHRRPGAAQLAVRVFDTAPAAPVRLVPTDPGAAAAEVVTHRLRVEAAAGQDHPDDDPPAPGRRRLLVGAGVAAALLVAGTGAAALVADGWPGGAGSAAVGARQAVGGHDGNGLSTVTQPAPSESAGPAPSSDGSASRDQTGQPGPADSAAWTAEQVGLSPAELDEVLAAMGADDPADAVTGLATLRAAAFSTGRVEPLELANAPGSASLADDTSVLLQLEDSGTLLEGLAFDVRQAETVSRSGDTAVLRAEVVTGEHRQVRSTDGSLLAEQPAGQPQGSQLTLLRIDGLWRVMAVS